MNMQIMVIDDHDANRRVMTQRLSKMNPFWSGTQYKNAEDAVSAAKNKTFHLIIMEEQFGPGMMTGTEAIQAIRANEEASCQTRSVIVSSTATLTELPPGENRRGLGYT